MDWNCFKILYFYLNFINVKYEIVLCTPYSKARCSPPSPRLNNVKKNCTFLLWRLPFLTSVCHITLINIYFQGISPLGILFWAFPFMRTSLTKKTLLSFFFGKKLFFWAHSWTKELFWILFLALFWELFILNTFWRAFLSTILSVLVWLENHIFWKPFFE